MAGLLKRLKDVVSSEAHDMLDKHESPDRIVRQLVRDATEKVTAGQKLTVDAVASEKQLSKQVAEHEAHLEKAQQSAQLALQNEDELGARRALENKLHHRKLIDALQPQLERAKENSDSLKAQLASLKQQLDSLKSEQLAIEARFNGAKATGKLDQMNSAMSLSDDTDSRLQQANSMVSVMEARNEAAAEVNMATSPTSNSNADLDLELEMAQLRKQMGK